MKKTFDPKVGLKNDFKFCRELEPYEMEISQYNVYRVGDTS